ncbi:MAG: tetratricopeptide repeat protein [bacterium]|nr:tetratricopeptide repeat protein [bacterium]
MIRRFTIPLPLLLLAALCTPGCNGPSDSDGVSEEAIAFNVLGTAYLGQQKWDDAEREFRRAAEAGPGDPLPRNNIAVAMIQDGRVEEARAQLEEVLALDEAHRQAHFNLGLIDKNEGRFPEAAAHFEVVERQDPDDLLTQYNLGVVYSRIERDEDAEAAFRRALKLNPSHVSSLYGLGRFLLQRGKQDEGAEMIALSQEIRARSGLDDAVGTQYGEQGPYAMGVDYPADALAAPETIAVTFQRATSARFTGASRWTLTRLGPSDEPALVISDEGQLTALTAGGKRELYDGESRIHAVAAGDVDSDGTVELVLWVRRGDTLQLGLLRDGAAELDTLSFSDVAGAAPVPGHASPSLVFVDRDHDGDLDLFGCWASGLDAEWGCLIGTNDSKGKFSMAPSTDHGFVPGSLGGATPRLAFSDLDNDRDIDLLVGGSEGIRVFSNERDGTFEEAAQNGLDGRGDIVTWEIADLNKDGLMDLVLAGSDRVELWTNRRGTLQPPEMLAEGPGRGLTLIDFDNDGFLDIARTAQDGNLLRNLGRGSWSYVQAGELGMNHFPIAAFDADRDGDLDLVVKPEVDEIELLDNHGGNARGWISLKMRGVSENRNGIGSKVEVLAAALRQKFEVTTPLDLHVGLGNRDNVESVRVLWPGGVLQDEINQPTGAVSEVTQLDRKGTSCPLLYAWRDGAWRFETDFLGGAAVGYQQKPGVFNTPDTDEYVKLEGGLTPDDDGTLRVRLNNQLEEVIWFDRVELIAVDHPAGTEVFPDEALMPGPPWKTDGLFVSSDVRPVSFARAVEDGRDLARALSERDGDYVGGFQPLPHKGYATLHTIELGLGELRPRERVVLLLDGWIDYADSSANVAAAQAGDSLVPPRLLVADGRGGFAASDVRMGFPAGLPKTMTVDLTGHVDPRDARVRIETSMRIHWDRARVLVGGENTAHRITRLQAASADLRFGGFPRPVQPGPNPAAYDPTRVDAHSTWKAHVGAYTAFGDVGELLGSIDDRFVTTRNGDEIELRFDAPADPRTGWTRTYLLFADGFGKDMDPNSAASLHVGPMPFHGMPTYPYGPDVERPDTGDAHSRPPRFVLDSQRGWPGARPLAVVAREE